MIPQIIGEPHPAIEPDDDAEVIARAHDTEPSRLWRMAVTKKGHKFMVYGRGSGTLVARESNRAGLVEAVHCVAWAICRAVLAEAILDQLEEGK
jgi:hypothetical protein